MCLFSFTPVSHILNLPVKLFVFPVKLVFIRLVLAWLCSWGVSVVFYLESTIQLPMLIIFCFSLGGGVISPPFCGKKTIGIFIRKITVNVLQALYAWSQNQSCSLQSNLEYNTTDRSELLNYILFSDIVHNQGSVDMVVHPLLENNSFCISFELIWSNRYVYRVFCTIRLITQVHLGSNKFI